MRLRQLPSPLMQLKLRKIVLWLCLAVTVSLPAELKIGDSYAQVLKEKGLPVSKIETGNVHLLNYPDRTIKLENGIVVALQAPTPSTPAIRPNPARTSTAKKQAASGPNAAENLTWQTDYTAALAQAKAENRQVFLFFTGSDWCSWCMRLNKEILSTAEFARYAKEKLVLVEVDFPKKERQPATLKSQNAKLAKLYHIEGYPTVIVLDSSSKKIDELGYQEGGPKPFIDHLAKR